MHRISRTLALAGLAGLLASAAAVAQVTVNGAPATIASVIKLVWNGQDISASNPLPVTAGAGGLPTAPATITRSAVVVTLPANTTTQVASAGLKSFAAQVQGSNPVVIGYDNTVCSGTGLTLAAANGTSPGQSTSEYPASTTAYWACSVAGSSVAVVRGQ